MSLSTYSGLQTSIGNFLNRGDLASIIPDFITLAEAQMARRFVSRSKSGLSIPRRLVKRTETSLVANDEFVACPSDFLGPKRFILESDPIKQLDYLGADSFTAMKKRDQWTGAPKYYTVIGSEFQFYPIVDQAYTGELHYIYRIAALSDAAPTNWLLTDYPDVYLYGALTASAPYLRDDARTQVWATLFQTAVEDVCEADPLPGDKTVLRPDTPSVTRYFDPTTLQNV